MSASKDSRASARKVCDENERKKKTARKKFFDGRKDFVWLLLKLDITNVDELQDNNSSHTKGTICLVNGVNGRQKDGFRAWAHERAPYNSQWLVQLISLFLKNQFLP